MLQNKLQQNARRFQLPGFTGLNLIPAGLGETRAKSNISQIECLSTKTSFKAYESLKRVKTVSLISNVARYQEADVNKP